MAMIHTTTYEERLHSAHKASRGFRVRPHQVFRGADAGAAAPPWSLHSPSSATCASERARMLCDDVLSIVFSRLCDPLEPRVALTFSSVSCDLRALTQAARQRLRAEHEAAAALCRKVGVQSCKQLRAATVFRWGRKELTAADLETLGTLGSALPALQQLVLFRNVATPDGVQRLAAGLGSGGLPAVIVLNLNKMQMGDAGASAVAAAIGRGALPRLEALGLGANGIGDAGLVALAPALRRLPALESLSLHDNPLGDEGAAALMTSPPTGALAKLLMIGLEFTQISDAGCATLASALYAGAMPSLQQLTMHGLHGVVGVNRAASAVYAALASERRRLLLLRSSASLLEL